MSAFSLNIDIERIHRSRHDAFGVLDGTLVLGRHDMKCKSRIDLRILQQTVFDHRQRAVSGFLARLKHELYFSFKRGLNLF